MNMNKILFLSLSVLAFILATTPVMADSLVSTTNPPAYINPQYFSPTNPAMEEAWLEGLLGFDVSYLGKDEVGNLFDMVPADWTYAVLKYGVGRPSATNPNHWAILDDGDQKVEPADIAGIPQEGLSHISYFGGSSTQVPEPSLLFLLGAGLVGIGASAWRKVK